ncbi:bacterial transcriptional activator domain-containing protein [Micromonospora rifamycinica]|uniref:AfsR/SARP family transcriptional regulator n=1 Tax=Micromonospora rifamycinica TaxID=291594 RepID=UPI00343EEA33
MSDVGRSATHRLDVDPASVDVLVFRQLIGAARFASGNRRRKLLDEAVGLWQGEPLIDAASLAFAANEISELRRLHRDAVADLGGAFRAEPPGPARAAMVDVRRLPVPHHSAFRSCERELALLDAAWWEGRQRIISVVAFGGEGKSTFINHWPRRFIARPDNGAGRIFAWSFSPGQLGGGAHRGGTAVLR